MDEDDSGEISDLELLQRAQFGKEVELFWSTPIGEYLQGRAREVYSAAINELKTVDPTDTKKIVKLQADIFKSEGFETWLSEVIMDGIKALDLLEQGPSE